MTFEKKFTLTVGIIALVSLIIDAQFHRTILNAVGCGLLGVVLIMSAMFWEK